MKTDKIIPNTTLLITVMLLCPVLTTPVFSARVAAADLVTINVTGNIVASPCTLDAGSVNQTVDFGQLLGTELNATGAASEWHAFRVKLNNCPAAAVNATATFSGLTYGPDATLYSNTGTAQNVAIQVAEEALKTCIKGNGTTMTVPVDNLTHTAQFALAGRVVAPAGHAGAGTLNTVMQMTFTYQ